MTLPALEAHDVTVSTIDGKLLVDHLNIRAYSGQTLVIVGESGAGKSLLSRALCALLPPQLKVTGSLTLAGITSDLATQKTHVRKQRGHGIVWLPQDPFTSLSPAHTCGQQILTHRPRTAHDHARISERLKEVGLPPRVAHMRPHELSGGMRQRVAIAAAIETHAHVLIADEPTTALDVTTQREILELLTGLCRDHGMALILITHDLAVAREFGDDVLVMRAGRMIEYGNITEVLRKPQHAYTRHLAAMEPRLDGENPRAHISAPALQQSRTDPAEPILSLRGVTKIFRSSRHEIHVALEGIDLDIYAGEAVGLVGESGSGKTTLARCIVGLERPDSGQIHTHMAHDYQNFPPLKTSRRGWKVPPVGLVFQNPYSALNPALTIGRTLSEALQAIGRDSGEIDDLLDSVGLPTAYARRLPRDLSGGERQRVAIARAIATQPRLLVCDEPVSALDVSVQAHVLELLESLRQERGFSLLFITHDLAVARAACDRLAVMKDGVIVEQGATSDILHHPHHPYTRLLLEAVPGRARNDIEENSPSTAQGNEQ
ncbi:ABC transporter ATP-binding protein [Schaalia sp. lx-100]|uniref:ABC transporter ATP-binding protein n=1 Tax=Schaalia sp. lx-100 TaxID=2899081 RepID=UPI001E29ED2B|nr:ABC transporter ATP-binding protein [Schaalia sp. lx-100]MCD4556680.1 ABC transporter ATP-binding protein [Schaalia sp. lx-100]